MIRIQEPSEKLIKAIAEDRKLNPARTTALRRTINGILSVQDQIEHWENTFGSYSMFKKCFQRIDKHLTLLRSEVTKNKQLIDHFLAQDISDSLGRLFETSPLDLQDVALELYIDVIGALHEPIKNRVASDRSNNGGRQLNWRRDVVLEMLAENSPAIIGRRATSTSGGPFLKLCDCVLRELKLSSEGLEKAVAAKLKRMKQRRKETPPRRRRQ